MPSILLDLDLTTFEALASLAIVERRPIPWQAEILVQRGLGLPRPTPDARQGLPIPEGQPQREFMSYAEE